MVSKANGNSREEIQDLISRINEAWLSGRAGELKDYFHDDMVIRGPDLTELARGRQSCVKSYEDFVQKALVRNFKASQPEVDLGEDLAVATFSWEISYEMQGQAHQEVGHDLYVFTRVGAQWQVIWRAVLLSPQLQ
jgi:hypothetical protein